LKQSISLNSYEKFQSLFFEQRKSKATKELFNLVNHAPGGDYQIQDVIIVSDEMKPLLEKMINPNSVNAVQNNEGQTIK
jgi:hypothetical protein